MADTNDYYFKKKDENDRPRINLSFKKPATFFLIIASIILIMSVFFKIGKIDVQGNSVYTDKEIIDASGIQTGDNLFFMNRIAAGSRVVVKLPYVDAVTITRGLPNRVSIIVEESSAVGYVAVKDELWTVNRTGKFLGTVSRDDAVYMARITGITVTSAAVGESIVPAENEQEKFEYLVDILDQIQGRGLTSKINSIDISDVDNPSIDFDNRYTIRLGENDNTEYKFGKFIAAMEQLSANDAGTLDVSEGNTVEFNPN